MYSKDAYEAKYQLLINKRESTGLKYLNDSNAFIEYSNDVNDIYKNIEEYTLNKEQKALIVFDDMIANVPSNKKLNPIVTDLFIRSRKIKKFSCFYYIIIFCYTKKYQTKLHTPFYYKNYKQARALTNCN